MVDINQAETLCKSCGLCCTGHLFIWTKLKPAELPPALSLGLNVFGTEPGQRGFSQPCPLWNGLCTIYTSPSYPHACRKYKCKLLKEVLDESIPLSNAIAVVQRTLGMIKELEPLLPKLQSNNFRERLVAQVEQWKESAKKDKVEQEFLTMAGELLSYYKKYFGVIGLTDIQDEE